MLKWIILPVIHTCWECLEEPKLTSNLIELNLLVLELGIHWIGILLQVWKVLDLVSLIFLPPLFGILIYKRWRWFPEMKRGRYIRYGPTILIQRNDHTLFGSEGWIHYRWSHYWPTIFPKKKTDSEKREERGEIRKGYLQLQILVWVDSMCSVIDTPRVKLTPFIYMY